jgi:hypothetical protein
VPKYRQEAAISALTGSKKRDVRAELSLIFNQLGNVRFFAGSHKPRHAGVDHPQLPGKIIARVKNPANRSIAINWHNGTHM